MKSIKYIFLALILSCSVLANSVWAGAEGYFLVYHLEKSQVTGELSLRPVEITFDTVSDPALAVFAEWHKPYLNNNKIEFIQANKAFFKGLKVETKRISGEKLEVFLDYTDCGEEIRKLKLKAEKNGIIEGTAAAIFYTENVPNMPPIETITIRVKGFFDDPKDATKSFSWSKLKKKWKPYMGAFEAIGKK